MYQFTPFVVHAKPQQKMESNINTPQRIVSKFSFMRGIYWGFDNYSRRFNCCLSNNPAAFKWWSGLI